MRRIAIVFCLLAACHHPDYEPHRPPVEGTLAPASDLLTAGNVTVLATTPPTREGAVAISPLNPRVVIAAAIEGSTENPTVSVFRSSDGGVTWRKSDPLPMNVGTRALVGLWDPVLAFDRTGTAYLAVVGSVNIQTWTFIVYRSTDGGETWVGTDVTPSAGRVDKPWIAVDNSAIYAVWYSFSSPGGLRFARSQNGVTWSEPRAFASQGWPFVAVGGPAAVYISYINSENSYAIRSSIDGGNTFSNESVITQIRPGGGDMPRTTAHQIAADGSNVYAVIPQGDAISFTRSTDRGASWSPLTILSSGTADASLPSIAVDPIMKELIISWLDRREEGPNARLFATRSHDGGVTFESAHAFSPPFQVGGFIGDYNQLAAYGGRSIAVFADASGSFAAARLWGDMPAPPVGRRRAVKRS